MKNSRWFFVLLCMSLFVLGIDAQNLDSAKLLFNGSTNVSLNPGEPWTLALTNGPPNTPFALCLSDNGQPAYCMADFGTTDSTGSWSIKREFNWSTVGGRTAWVKFSSGKLSDRVHFVVNFPVNRVYGLNFSPYITGQDPNKGSWVDENQIRNRMSIIASHTKWIRSFSLSRGSENIPRIAREFGLKVAAGAWLDKNLAVNESEINTLIGLILSGDVDIAIVGSEVFLRNDLTENQMLQYIAKIRAYAPSAIIAVADVYQQLLDHPNVVKACDVVFANYYPYWEGQSINTALDFVKTKHSLLRTTYPTKEIYISETGWPSSGNTVGLAVPSLENAVNYFLKFVSWAHGTGQKYFYFEAFDERWKELYEGALISWGLLDENGNMKAGIYEVFYGKLIPELSADTTPPTVPAGLTVTSPAIYQVNLSWNASTDLNVDGAATSGIAGYKVYRNDTLVSTTTALTYHDSNLADGIYKYSVASYDLANNVSARSNVVSITLSSSACPPPGGAGTPSMEFVYVPPLGSYNNLKGKILHISPEGYYVGVYIHVNGWGWVVKPSFDYPRTTIKCDGTWEADVTTGGSDQLADQITAFLLPSSFSLPLSGRDATLPASLDQNAVAKVSVTRK